MEFTPAPPIRTVQPGTYAGGMISGQRTEVPRDIDAGIIVTVEDVSGYSGGGITKLNNVTTLTFDNTVFDLYDGGGGQAIIKCKGT
jgi:N-acetyl-gamma-glutamylphosphate reductase